MGWLKDAIDRGDCLNRTGVNMSMYHFMSWGNSKDEERGMPALWQGNARKNMARWDETGAGKLADLPDHEGDCLVFVGASPILRESVAHLRELDPRFKLVCTNSSLRFLLDHGVTPHYCLLVDGAPGRWTEEWKSLPETCRDVTGIFAVAACPEAVALWPGKFVVIPYDVGEDELTAVIREKYGENAPVGGGNALNCGVALFVQFTRCTMYMFVANELSYRDKYYVEGPAISDGKPCVMATNIYGEEVRTLVNLYEYKLWLENFINSFAYSHYFVDCSEGILGVESDGTLMPFLDYKKLPEALFSISEAWRLESEATPEEKSKLVYQELYDNHGYHATLGAGYWGQLTAGENLSIMEHDGIHRILDFGCGDGAGVRALRNLGYDSYGVDIANNAKQWAENKVAPFCSDYDGKTIPYADEEFDMVGCFETMEHIPEEMAESTLREIFRVGRRHYVFTIALQQEASPIHGQWHYHVTIRPPEWWIGKLESIGYKILNANKQIYNRMNGRDYATLFVFATRDDTGIRCDSRWDLCQTSNAPL